MKLKDLVNLLGAEVITPTSYEPNREVNYAFSCDLMSDALMLLRNAPLYFCDEGVLVTGLSTIQGIRTGEMLDIKIILIARGKTPSDSMIDEANRIGITVLKSNHSMFSTNGIMYQAGFKGISDIL